MVIPYRSSRLPDCFPFFFFLFFPKGDARAHTDLISTLRASETNLSNSFWTQNYETEYFFKHIFSSEMFMTFLLHLFNLHILSILILWTEQNKCSATWNIFMYLDNAREKKQGQNIVKKSFLCFLELHRNSYTANISDAIFCEGRFFHSRSQGIALIFCCCVCI